MIKKLRKIKALLNRGEKLSVKVKKNIVLSFLIRGLSIVSSFILVPLTLNYIGVEQFGIWLTLSSIIAWFGYFDIGMGNGLKNKLAAALALDDLVNARMYVSTAYAGLAIIFGFLMIVFLSVNPFLDWANILNASEVGTRELLLVVQVVGAFFFIQFVLKLIGTILVADNRPAINNGILPVSNIISLLIIYILTLTTKGSLFYLSIAYAGVPVLIYFLLGIFFFSGQYKYLKPSVKYVNFGHFKSLFNLGFKFLILQASVMVIFTTDNLIITRILGPEHVTPYNIAYRYFNLITVGFGIILQPTWAAYTNAYVRGEFGWITGVVKKMVYACLGFLGIAILMLLVSAPFYKFWVGDKVHIEFTITLFMGLSVMLAAWSNIFVMLINATEKIRLQLYLTLFGAIINVPLSIYFARNLEMGATGVILATCVTILPGAFLFPYQYLRIINKKDKGVWGK